MPKNEAHTKHKGSNILNRIFLSFTTLGNMSFFNWSCKAGQGPKNDMPSEKNRFPTTCMVPEEGLLPGYPFGSGYSSFSWPGLPR